MPDITYTVTEEWSEDTIRDWATFETRETPRLPIESKRIEACRQWVAENPEYPDGTLAFVVANEGVHLAAHMGNGCWVGLSQHTGYNDSYLSNVGRVERVVHTPPTIRDHLHTIGLDDEMIRGIARGFNSRETSADINHALIDACREAEGL